MNSSIWRLKWLKIEKIVQTSPFGKKLSFKSLHKYAGVWVRFCGSRKVFQETRTKLTSRLIKQLKKFRGCWSDFIYICVYTYIYKEFFTDTWIFSPNDSLNKPMKMSITHAGSSTRGASLLAQSTQTQIWGAGFKEQHHSSLAKIARKVNEKTWETTATNPKCGILAVTEGYGSYFKKRTWYQVLIL